MSKWIDDTNYNPDDKIRIPRAWKIVDNRGETLIGIYHFKNDKKCWFLSCDALQINSYHMESKDPDAAKQEAIKVVREKLARLNKAFEELT